MDLCLERYTQQDLENVAKIILNVKIFNLKCWWLLSYCVNFSVIKGQALKKDYFVISRGCISNICKIDIAYV